MRDLVFVLALFAAGCGATRTSMIGLDGMRARGATFGVRGSVIVVERTDPMGGALVMNDAYLDGDRVVLGALVTSSGSESARRACVDVGALGPASGWEHRLAWREPDGSLVRIEATETDATCP